MKRVLNLKDCNVYYVNLMINNNGTVKERSIVLTAKDNMELNDKIIRWTKVIYGHSRNVISNLKISKLSKKIKITADEFGSAVILL